MTVQEYVMWFLLAWVAAGLSGLMFSMVLELCVRAAVRGYYEQRFESNRNNYLKGEKDGRQAGP